jgi:replicative DNA helicase
MSSSSTKGGEFASFFRAVRRLKPLWQGVKSAAEEMDRYTQGDYGDRVGTGIPKLDRRLRGGMRAGEMLLIGAPTGGGKTSFVAQVAVSAAAKGRPVMLVSPEMSIETLAEREIIRRAGRKLWDRNPWTAHGPWKDSCIEAHTVAASEMLDEKLPLLVLDQSDVTMIEIEETAREIPGLQLLVIDYAQQVAGDSNDSPRYLQVGDVGTRAVALAQALNIPVIVASQVNVTKDGSKRGYSFRETAILEHKAHAVLILDVEWNDDGEQRTVSKATIVCTKHRSASAFRLQVHYDPATYTVGDLEDDTRPSTYALLPPAMPR